MSSLSTRFRAGRATDAEAWPQRDEGRQLRLAAFLRTLVAGLLFAAALGCRRGYPMARLAARVVDDKNAPVGGVAADLFKVTSTGRVYWRASRTSGNGIARFGGEEGVIEGDYIVRVTPLAFQRVAQGEPHERSVHLNEGDDVVATFRVVPRRPAPPPLAPR